MITIICEKTGIPFEAENRRRKSHPTVMAWLSQAHEEGWYQQANDVIYGSDARCIEKQQFQTIEQFTAYFEQLRATSIEANNAHRTAEVEREREIKEARQQRYITNNLLRGRGYHWEKLENDEEDIDFFGVPEFEWILKGADGRVVSVQEAMQELAYEGAQFAKEWLSERGIDEEMPEIEKRRQEEAAKVQQIEDAANTPERIAYQQEMIPFLLEAGLTPERATYEAKRLSLPHSPQEDDVRIMPIQLPTTEAALVINSDIRYGVLIYGIWYGIDEVIGSYPETTTQLAIYADRNNRKSV
jgi:ribosomal protein L24